MGIITKREVYLLMRRYCLLIFLIGLFVFGCQSNKPRQETRTLEGLSPEQKIEALQKELYASAVKYAKAKGYHFGSGANYWFEEAATRAAHDIVNMAPTEQGSKTETARQNMQRMIDQMIIEIDNIPGYREQSPHAIGEQTYMRAEHVLCPLWPICN